MPRPPKNTLQFTDRSIRAIRSTADRVDYMDPTLRGFGLMVRPSGTKTFFLRYRRGRIERRLTLGDYPTISLARARKLAQEFLGLVAAGDDPQADRHEQRQAMTFGDLASAYLETRAQRRMVPGTLREEERVVRHDLLPVLRQHLAADIRRRDIALLLDAIVARGAEIQANRTRSVLSRIFAFAVEREIVEYNPVSQLRRPTEEQSRQRVLSEEEIRALWATWEAESSITSTLFRILLLTAQRKQEVAGMRWADIERSWWTVPTTLTKNRLAHRVFLAPQTLRLLADLHPLTGTGQHVFSSSRRPGNPLVWITKASLRYRKVTGIPDWRPHDLRRTAATHMGRIGIPRTAIARVLNHVDRGITAVYDRSTGEPEIEHALKAWDLRLAEIVQQRDPAHNILSFATP
jgi:integrase